MARPYIEFINSQNLNWYPKPELCGRPDLEVKVLSKDTETGESTILVKYPPLWTSSKPEWCDADEEIFVLKGSFRVNERQFARHHYAYWPQGYVRENFYVGPDGAELVVCFSGGPTYYIDVERAPVVSRASLVEHLNTFDMQWDQTNMDPNISHLNAFRKNLRLGPNGSGRTYLLGGMPQGYPSSGSEPLERHPHNEEMFMVSGDMPCSLGVMRTGAYFWRPPKIWHGADCTLSGFLLFCQTPGTNQTVSEWSDEDHPVIMDPEHKPVLPEAYQDSDKPIPDPLWY